MITSKEYKDALEIFVFVINRSDVPEELKKQTVALLEQTFGMVYSVGRADGVKDLTAKFYQGESNGTTN